MFLLLLPLEADAKTIHVPEDYETIQQAVFVAEDQDTILLSPGTYRESVHMIGKNINLEGTDRESCIIEFPATDYYNPPVQMSAGALQNLTVVATRSAGDGTSYSAYCLHADYDAMEGNTIIVRNVHFIGESNQAVGIGLRPNCTVAFYDCFLENIGNKGALFVHNFESYRQDTQGQRLILARCLIQNHSLEPTIVIQAQGFGMPVAKALLLNNVVYNTMGAPFLMRYYSVRENFMPRDQALVMGSSDWVLDPLSSGNNVQMMNMASILGDTVP